MDYERINKPQSGIISPRLSPQKLRLKLMGVQKSRKGLEAESSISLPTSGLDKVECAKDSLLASGSGNVYDEEGVIFPENARVETEETDVSRPEGTLTASTTKEDASDSGTAAQNGMLSKDLHSKENRHIQGKIHGLGKSPTMQMELIHGMSFVNSMRTLEEESYEYDSGHENCSVSSFEFHKGERNLQRRVLGPSFRPAPSKWDDAEKWLVNQNKVRSGYGLSQGMIANLPKKVTFSGQGGRPAPRTSTIGCTEVISVDGPTMPPDAGEFQKFYIDKSVSSQKDPASSKFAFMPAVANSYNKANASLDRYPLEDMSNSGLDDAQQRLTEAESQLRSSLRNEKPLADPPCNGSECSDQANHQGTPAVRSVSMRDMGTEMTPIASQEPSRTGTPVRATTPNARSPVSSRPSTPGRGAPASSPIYVTDNELESQERRKASELSEKELHAKTRQEIIALGAKLGKTNITAWARKQEQQENSTKSFETKDSRLSTISALDARALAWEEAEKVKYMASHKREELKIQSWENHEKTKAEAELRRIEVKAERMRSHAHEKLMNKLAAIQHRAEARRAAAEAKRIQQAAKTSQKAEYIRQTGRIPSPFFSSCCCS